jgi:OOP family OmpA-OmpF porin
MQGKRIFLSIVTGFACLSYVLPAVADVEGMSVPEGWYIEANGGSSKLSGKSYPGSTNKSGIGGNVNFGYKFIPYFAVEIGGSRYANTTIKNSAGVKIGTDYHYSYDLALRGILPAGTTGLEAFAKVGVGRIVSNIDRSNNVSSATLSSSSHSVTGLYLGVGGQYYFMPELAANIQWQRAQGNSSTGTQDLYSVGLSFLFD